MTSATGLGIPGFETITVLDDARDTTLRARNTRTGADVVIKLLDRAKEPILPKRFDRARRSLLHLTKRNAGLIPLLGNGVANDGRDYIISPYYPLGSLQDQIAAGPTPWRLAAAMASKIAGIIAPAHSEGLVLGDVRPSSVFLESVGTPAVAAFGVATRRFDDGRPVFASPERIAENPHLTPTSDVYSLALVFGALIAGRARTRAESTEEFLAELSTLAPERIMDVLDHGLAVSPTNRYRDAGTMQRAILAAIDADPDAPTAEEHDEPFDFDEVFEPVSNDAGRATSGVAVRLTPESLPPGLEDITFISEQDQIDKMDEVVATTDLPTDLDHYAIASTTLDIEVNPDTGDFLNGNQHPGNGHEPNGNDNGQNGNGSDSGNGSGSTRSSAGTLVQEIDRKTEHSPNGFENGSAEPDHLVSAEDQTSVLQLDDLVAEAEDQTSVLQLDELDAEAEDQTSVLQLDELEAAAEERTPVEDQTSVLHVDDLLAAEDQTSVLQLDDLAGAAEDKTSVLQLDELAAAAKDKTSVLRLDELTVSNDETSVLQLDDLRDIAQTEPARDGIDLAVSEAGFNDDQTDVFRDGDNEVPYDADHEHGVTESEHLPPPPTDLPFSLGAAPLLDLIDSGEEIPFPSHDRSRKTREASSFADRARVAVEVTWFRRRRALATAAAMLGLAIIAATIIYFLAQEVRTSTKIEAEGVHQSSTTVAPAGPATFVATNVPYVVDRPERRTTTTLAPRRPATPAAPVETTLAPAGNGQQPGATAAPADEEDPDGGEILPPTPPDPDAPGPTTPPGPPAETTVLPPATERPGRPTAPEPPATTEAPPATEAPPDDDDDDDDEDVVAPPAAQPPSASLTVSRVRRTSAVVRVNSDQCVATRFVLAGGGSPQEGSTAGFNPSSSCSGGWRLDFFGSSGLTPDTNYTLTVWVKAVDTELVSSTSISFTTRD